MDESLRSMLKLKQSMFDVNENAMMSAKLISERDEIIKNQQLRINQLEQDVKHLTSKNAELQNLLTLATLQSAKKLEEPKVSKPVTVDSQNSNLPIRLEGTVEWNPAPIFPWNSNFPMFTLPGGGIYIKQEQSEATPIVKEKQSRKKKKKKDRKRKRSSSDSDSTSSDSEDRRRKKKSKKNKKHYESDSDDDSTDRKKKRKKEKRKRKKKKSRERETSASTSTTETEDEAPKSQKAKTRKGKGNVKRSTLKFDKFWSSSSEEEEDAKTTKANAKNTTKQVRSKKVARRGKTKVNKGQEQQEVEKSMSQESDISTPNSKLPEVDFFPLGERNVSQVRRQRLMSTGVGTFSSSKVTQKQDLSRPKVETTASVPLASASSTPNSKSGLNDTASNQDQNKSGFAKSFALQRPIFKPTPKSSFFKPVSRVSHPATITAPKALQSPPATSPPESTIPAALPNGTLSVPKNEDVRASSPLDISVQGNVPILQVPEIVDAVPEKNSKGPERTNNYKKINFVPETAPSKPQDQDSPFQPPSTKIVPDKPPLAQKVDNEVSDLPSVFPDIDVYDELFSAPQTCASKGDSGMSSRNLDTYVGKSNKSTFLETIYDLAKADYATKKATMEEMKLPLSSDRPQFEITFNLINSLLGRFWKASAEEDVLKIVSAIGNVKPEFVALRRHILIQLFYVDIRDERASPCDDDDASSPILTLKQMKIFTMLCLLERNEAFKEITFQFSQFTQYRLVSGMSPLMRFKNWQLVNLTKILVSIFKFKGDESATRTLLFDVMFCHEPRSHLVSLIILKAWPEVFTRRRFENGNCALDPLVDTVFWTIHNTGTAANMTTLSIFDCRNYLTKECGFGPNKQILAPDLIKDLISGALANMANPNVTKSFALSLALIARWKTEKGFVSQHIISRLVDVMRTIDVENIVGEGDDQNKDQATFIWVIQCLGYVSRSSFLDFETKVSVFDSLRNNLMSRRKISRKLENLTLKAILQIGSNLQFQVMKLFQDWQPSSCDLDEDVKQVLMDFMTSRGQKFGKNMIENIQNRKLADAMNQIKQKLQK